MPAVSPPLVRRDDALNSYIIPDRDLQLEDRQALRKAARDALVFAATANGVGIVTDSSGLTVRIIEPTGDLAFGANANNTFLTAALVANTESAVVNQTLPNNVYHVFYGVGIETVLPNVTPASVLLRFLQGSSGSTILRVHLEELYSNGNQNAPFVGWFSYPVLYKPSQAEWIGLTPRIAAAGGERVVLYGYIGENRGRNVAGPESL